jgi:hypothetical protein
VYKKILRANAKIGFRRYFGSGKKVGNAREKPALQKALINHINMMVIIKNFSKFPGSPCPKEFLTGKA